MEKDITLDIQKRPADVLIIKRDIETINQESDLYWIYRRDWLEESFDKGQKNEKEYKVGLFEQGSLIIDKLLFLANLNGLLLITRTEMTVLYEFLYW